MNLPQRIFISISSNSFENFDYRYLLIIYTSQHEFYLHFSYRNFLLELITSFKTQTTFPVLSSFQLSQIDDDSLHSLVRSLNKKQCDAYEIVLKWCRDKVKSLNSEKPYKTVPIHLFITDDLTTFETLLKFSLYDFNDYDNELTHHQIPTHD